MKDLYAKLGVEPTASGREIAERLKQKPELAPIGTILLNPEKRAVYDGAYSTLKTIGALRHRLGLDKGESWFLKTHPHFAPSLTSMAKTRQAPSASQPATQPAAPAATAHAPTPASGPKSSKKGIVVAVLLAAALAVIYFLSR